MLLLPLRPTSTAASSFEPGCLCPAAHAQIFNSAERLSIVASQLAQALGDARAAYCAACSTVCQVEQFSFSNAFCAINYMKHSLGSEASLTLQFGNQPLHMPILAKLESSSCADVSFRGGILRGASERLWQPVDLPHSGYLYLYAGHRQMARPRF